VKRHTLAVTGMSCDGCERTVENALTTLGGVTRVEADHDGDTVEVVADDELDPADIHAAIEGAGFDVSV